MKRLLLCVTFVGVLLSVGRAGAYAVTSFLSMCVDPRVGFAEVCAGSEPSPICNQQTEPWRFSAVGFGEPGYESCIVDPVESRTWGAVKALYK